MRMHFNITFVRILTILSTFGEYKVCVLILCTYNTMCRAGYGNVKFLRYLQPVMHSTMLVNRKVIDK